MSDGFMEIFLVVLTLVNMLILASSRIRNCVRLAGLHGAVVALLPLICREGGHFAFANFATTAAVIGIKSILIPVFLLKTLKAAGVRREVEPYIGYSLSIIFGAASLGLSFWLASRLPLPETGLSPLAVPVAFSTIFIGLLITITRKKAVTQIIGYLIFENGIYLLGGVLPIEHGLIIELGILLDVFVLVFIMGVAVFHIREQFDHIDTDKLSSLGDAVMPSPKTEGRPL